MNSLFYSDMFFIYVFLGYYFFVLFLKYIFCSFGCFKLMKRQKLKFRALAFCPFINSSYVLGSVSDAVNKHYFRDSYSKYVLLMLKVMVYCSVFFMVKVILFRVSNFLKMFVGFLKGDDFYDLYALIKVLVEDVPSRCFILFAFLISITYVVYLVKVYSNLFFEYGGKLSKFCVLMTVVGFVVFRAFFVPDLFLFLFRNKTSNFEKLNKDKNYI